MRQGQEVGQAEDVGGSAASTSDDGSFRPRIIRRGGRRFPIVIEESVLRPQVGDPDVMAEQLGYLLQVAALPTVTPG
ncbi:Scr1 family TA system antitoxin-like transcriptional regulator [Streptomyces clavifer]|uniref:Scr1 family TA system antitoxin-like transcriptional regulator n=1 Tax=Streptomyces clavifer TaxID=68188 RepID=UPI00380269AC